jgi:lipopolysaccharide O-acetyltransferase
MDFIRSILRFRSENGLYVLLQHIAETPLNWARNRMLASQFGIRRIRIGHGALLRGLSHVAVGENFAAGNGLWLEAVLRYNDQIFSPRIIIGRNVAISSWSHIAATHYVEIGDGVLIGSNVMITDHDHGQYNGPNTLPEVPPSFRPLTSTGRVVIGSNVWLGNNVVITAGSQIGEGSVIGANSVVKGKIPSCTLAAGVPAKALKRFDSTTGEWVRIQ